VLGRLPGPAQQTHDLGVAHGIPGVIAFLAQVYRLGLAHARVQRLLDGAIDWLFRQRRTADDGAVFAYTSEDYACAARLAWCYGDLGIAATLWMAGDCAARSEWKRQAGWLARLAAKRTLKESGIIDPFLCHGAAGVAHLFNRLYQNTGDILLREAAVNWYSHLLGADFNREAEERDSEASDSDPISSARVLGLLEGEIGVALSLLSATTSAAPTWDRILLISTKWA
jgi:lantibiotic biosynthesis protein